MIGKISKFYQTNFLISEKFLIFVCSALICVNLVNIGLNKVSVDWLGYLSSIGISLGLIGLGLFYRLSGRNLRIAQALFGSSLFIFFTIVMSTYNYLMLPLKYPLIDQALVKIDASLGYSWPAIMNWAMENPRFSSVLKVVYISTIPQIIVLMIWHGLSGRAKDLEKLLITIAVSAIIAICFWTLFPSLGPATLYELSPEIWNSVSPVVNQEYAVELREIGTNGPKIIAPDEVRGLIAFPSFHAVLAFIALWSSRKIKYLFPLFLIVNLLMMPATLIHGGHHLIDLPAGFVTFLLGVLAANAHFKLNGAKQNKPIPN